MKVQELVEARAIKEYTVKRLADSEQHRYGASPGKAVMAQVIRTSDGAEMLESPTYLAQVKRYANDMINKTSMGLYLIDRHDKGFPPET